MKYLEVLTALVNPVPITGRFLAHNRKNRIERAFLAADLHTGAKGLVEPTVSQSALLTGEPHLCLVGRQAPGRADADRSGPGPADPCLLSRACSKWQQRSAGTGNRNP
jgi:hypothetical protein